jgi:hypothetical protein
MINAKCEPGRIPRLLAWLMPLLCGVGLMLATPAHAASNWTLKVQSSIGGNNSRLTLGEFADASTGFDLLYDAPAHPAAAAVSAYFYHPEWSRPETQFWYDIQSFGRVREWTFYTNSSLQNQNLTLGWDPAAIPSAFTATLIDVDTGQTVSMNNQASYTFPHAAIRTFKVVAEFPMPPVLTVISPGDSAIVSSSSITITGTATDAGQGDDGVATVTVNGSPAVGGTASGAAIASWSYQTTLTEGLNTFTIAATDNSVYKDQVTKAITVTYIPGNVDSDQDGLSDSWEMNYFGNLTTANAATDTDNDGLSDVNEQTQGTHPLQEDTDGDGLRDGQEISYGTNPNAADTDGDGDSDGMEVKYGTNPALNTDNLNSHRPNTPVIASISGSVPIEGTIFDATGFSDPDQLNGDYLAASQWQLATQFTFDASSMILDRVLSRDTSSSVSARHRTLAVPRGILLGNTQYWIRTRHQDKAGLWSEWSTAAAFGTVTSDVNDIDQDGVADSAQVNSYVDTNRNNIDDRTETQIKPVYDAATSTPVGIEINQGSLGSVSTLSTATISAERLPAATTPYALFDFRIGGLPVDVNNPAKVTVKFHFPNPLPAGVKWYKYDPVNDRFTDISDKAVFSGNQATVTLTDGGIEDADGTVNGVIVDPSGPGVPTVSASGTSSGGSGGGGVIDLILPTFAMAALRRRRRG